MYGHYRVASCVNKTKLANPLFNAKEVIKLSKELEEKRVGVGVFPELTLLGYTIGDLLFQQTLLKAQEEALFSILEESKKISTILVIGIALNIENRIYNTAFILQYGKILGIVPKSYLPNKKEYYESRYFTSGFYETKKEIEFLNYSIPFGLDILFKDNLGLIFGVEICEDLWAITPPSLQMATNGANLILNLSASNEFIGKQSYRRELVKTQSARTVSAYIYSSCGVGESSTDTLFGGEALICEYGSIIKENSRFNEESHFIFADIDIEKLNALRVSETSINQAKKTLYREIKISSLLDIKEINREIYPHPFIPISDKKARCEEITSIQAYSLIRRMESAKIKKAIIGVSGGLDSTLALLSINKAFEIKNWNKKDILAITMPSIGTTSKTKSNAIKLSQALNVTLKEINIENLAKEQLKAIEHTKEDVTFENVQARLRTAILMNIANKENGLVVGTGDLSEVALGWSTFNADQMSMYNLNASIPKTLISYLIDYFTTNQNIAPILKDILATPISPELMPNKNDTITQKTEDIIGPYELHDFFLYHFIKYGATPPKILYLASLAFKNKYKKEEIEKWLKLFLKRFFTQQFKRSTMPDGPKVGTISLSPRADWRMPSDSTFDIWLKML